MIRFEEDDEAFSRRRRRGNSPSSYRVGIGGESSRRWDDSPTDRDGPREGVGGGGFRPMNGPPPVLGRVDFQQMGPRDGGSFQPMGFPSDGGVRGFWPMTPSGIVGAEGMREMDGAGAGSGGAFRPRGAVSFPPLSPDVGGFSGGMGFQATAGKVVESDYSVRPTQPAPQQPLSGQKRGLPFSEYGSSTGTDVSDRSSAVKLFVGSVPRTAKEEEVRPLFEQHGNVLEVALIKDKRTGLQQGCCFVKYATSEDADRAIRALHNQITLPGGTGPVQVRYADGERERIGALEFKLFVGSLSRQATEKEVEEIFLQFGRVEDVYLMRDDNRQSRGCGFVKYSSKEAAMGAINGLNGTFTMRGCNQPLIVRFAEPKRPKPGEPRDVAPPLGLASGPRFQAPGPSPLNVSVPSGDLSHTNPWPTTSSPKIGPPSNPENRGIGNDFTSGQGQAALPSNQGGPLGGYGVPPLNPLPVPGVSSSGTSQQQNPAAGQQISPLYKPLHSSHNIPPRPQTNLPGSQAAFNQVASMQNPYGYSSQLPTSQLAPQKNITPATAPQTPLNINLRPTPVSSATDQLPPRAQQQPLQKMQHPPSQLAQLLSQQTQTLQATFQSSQQAFSQLQQQLQSMQQPNQHVSVPQNGQAGKQQWTGSATPTVVSTTSSTPVGDGPSAASAVSQNIGSVRCNWTEHTSPDGFKYYYNGLTGESKWEKPEEMLVFERQQQQQQQHQQHQQHQQQQQQHQQQEQQHQQQQQQQPTIKQPQTQLQLPLNSQPMQQQPQQVHQLQSQYQGHHQSQLPQNSQPNQQQPQQVHQFQSQQPFYSSLYSTPGISQNSQYPSMAVGQSSKEYGQAHIQVGAASINDSSRTQQGRQSPQDLSWRHKQSGT